MSRSTDADVFQTSVDTFSDIDDLSTLYDAVLSNASRRVIDEIPHESGRRQLHLVDFADRTVSIEDRQQRNGDDHDRQWRREHRNETSESRRRINIAVPGRKSRILSSRRPLILSRTYPTVDTIRMR